MLLTDRLYRYQNYGPDLYDALAALAKERDRIQKTIDAITRCRDMGILGNNPAEQEVVAENRDPEFCDC